MVEINYYLLSAENFDSGRLTQAIDTVRAWQTEGSYYGEVRQDERTLRFELIVNQKFSEQEVQIDLAELSSTPAEYRVALNGYSTFYVGDGAGGYHVIIKNKDKKTVFNNEELSNKELIVFTIARPGEYKVSDKGSGAKGKIKVSYPQPDRRRTAQDEGVRMVKIEDKKFCVIQADGKCVPSVIDVTSTQPISFEAAKDTRIKIEIDKAINSLDEENGNPIA